MALFALFIGIVLIVAAIRNSQSALFSALSTDVPEFVVWAAAIIAIGAIGFVPGLKPVSRWILALIIIVIIVQNYQNVVKGFQNAWQNPPKATPASSASTSAASSSAPVAAPSSNSLLQLFKDSGSNILE